ncbi:hypothetical protein [Geodermatophilus sp. DSM 44513]|uniref:hypothetical protein n=1 Tax=Geodermatophilus sp. DSM 44513 TaxID=1528104 RepID=UPI00141369AD|nr:hypothetical protein [Geodermatophilus sp. DSM 44513]WNV76020.1 hypothetical protein RTG05_01795 [Geodermatophilus sp. DSM 44513]
MGLLVTGDGVASGPVVGRRAVQAAGRSARTAVVPPLRSLVVVIVVVPVLSWSWSA